MKRTKNVGIEEIYKERQKEDISICMRIYTSIKCPPEFSHRTECLPSIMPTLLQASMVELKRIARKQSGGQIIDARS